MIEFEDITVRFGGVVALDAVSSTMDAPISGLIGPNGAGKTTLLNVISGFVRPADGSIRASGISLLGMQPYRRARWGIRRSFQQEQIVDDLTVVENIQIMSDALPLSRQDADSELERVLAFLGLAERRSTSGAQLTMLERRKTEIAKALIAGPRFVLLDEPGGGLSGTEAEGLRAIIRGIPQEFGAQVLLIDHDVDLIRAVCEKTLVLDFGKKIAEGPTAEVLEDRRVRAAYLGEIDAE